MEPEDLLDAVRKAAKDAKRAAVLTALAVFIAVAVLAIDNGIKRGIVDEAQNVRRLLAELKQAVAAARKEAVGGTEETGEDGADPGAPVGTGNGVVHDATPGEVLGEAAAAPVRAPVRKPAGTRRGTAGNGRRVARS